MAQTLSLQLREGTKDSHRSAERSPFIKRFFKGQLSKQEYGTFLRQLYTVYAALEKHHEDHHAHAVLGKIYFPELNRKAAIIQDLNYYFGGNAWEKISPTPAALEYAGRITALADSWPEGLVAHHYTRYLGDLSGGQALKRIIAKTFELPSTEGLAFYEFDGIPDHAAFKDSYRSRLDILPVDAQTCERIVAEANRAFDLNRAIFDLIEVQEVPAVLAE